MHTAHHPQSVLGRAPRATTPPYPGRPWPEVPRPGAPGVPSSPEPAPRPILPGWYESTSVSLERELADRLLAERVILVGGRLDDGLANHVAAELLLLDAGGNDPITIHLSSADSGLDAALSVAAAIDLIGAPVHVVARGTVRGPAIAVLAAAAQRRAHKHTMFVFSVPPFTANGTADELAALDAQHEREVARLRDLITQATGRTSDEVAEDLTAGRVLSAEEARTYGLISDLL
ncbi:ATP-dependent Clp protease protease subunit [Kribbella aluminosa]|uniref:ATP-dependent Clp protease proteolytic subunit n=1 Tax=Kribbella aluminosa TaxID=416017 RepID=A0ABS4ULB3_9ACTN|nr:ATP-dependent Clp protease proteolytic subunit [Kribbella aluminosa]MBP2352429.1 ATP-dependent Clp protease protease subunit [Kribbella aluminosa]